METSKPKPDMPIMPFGRIMACRQRLLKALTQFAGFRLVGLEVQKDVASVLYHSLVDWPGYEGQFTAGITDGENKMFQAIKATIEERFTNVVMTDDVAMQLVKVVAGNLDQLRLGVPVRKWVAQDKDEWVLLLVMGAARKHTPKRHIPGADLKLQVVTGSPAGDTFVQFFTDRALMRLAQFIGMLSKWERKRVHPNEFVQMKFAGRLQKGADLFMCEYHERGALNDRNKQLFAARKTPGRVCPHNYVVQCYACHVGFDSCPLGTHRRTLVRQHCPRCRNEDYFDPEFPGVKTCLHCQVTIWRSAG